MEKLQPLLELPIQHSILSFFTQFVNSKATQKVLQVADKISNCFCILLYCSSEILPCHNFTTWFQALPQTFCCYFHSTGLFIHKQIHPTQPKFFPSDVLPVGSTAPLLSNSSSMLLFPNLETNHPNILLDFSQRTCQ